MTLTIKRVEEPLELYRKYPRQANPQEVHIELDTEKRTVRTEYNAEIGNAVPMKVFDGKVIRWTYPNNQIPTMESANAIMEELKPKLEVACDGDEEMVMEISMVVESSLEMEDLLIVWDAGDWLAPTTTEELCITPNTTDEEIEALATELLAEAHADGIHWVENLEEELFDRRDQLVYK